MSVGGVAGGTVDGQTGSCLVVGIEPGAQTGGKTHLDEEYYGM